MTAETGLKYVLRFIALFSCMALAGIVIPPAYLGWLLNKAQPGTPNGILTNYLFRMLCLMYAWAGLQCWVYSTDIHRYMPLIWIVGIGSLILAGAGMALLLVLVPAEQQSGAFWIFFADFAEGFVQAVVLVVLLLRIRKRPYERRPAVL